MEDVRWRIKDFEELMKLHLNRAQGMEIQAQRRQIKTQEVKIEQLREEARCRTTGRDALGGPAIGGEGHLLPDVRVARTAHPRRRLTRVQPR